MSTAKPVSQRILIIDDNPANLALFQKILKNGGYDTVVTSDGETALKMAFNSLIDLVILDSNLPGKNGFQIFEKFKSNPVTLYIEDNDENLNLMRKIFLRRPFLKLIYASEAKTGIDLARSQHPDLILMDINLPGMDGITAMRQLKSVMETRNIPVVALSANALKTQINNAMKEGFIHYITKPIKITEFLNTLDRLLE